MAFKIASLQAFREGYAKAKPVILEPVMKVEVSAPEEFQGAIVGGLNQRRGVILNTESVEGFAVVAAEVPLSEMFGYSTIVRSATQGKAEFTMEFAKYLPVPKQEQDKLIAQYQEKKKAEAR
jgi:elongation factor G